MQSHRLHSSCRTARWEASLLPHLHHLWAKQKKESVWVCAAEIIFIKSGTCLVAPHLEKKRNECADMHRIHATSVWTGAWLLFRLATPPFDIVGNVLGFTGVSPPLKTIKTTVCGLSLKPLFWGSAVGFHFFRFAFILSLLLLFCFYYLIFTFRFVWYLLSSLKYVQQRPRFASAPIYAAIYKLSEKWIEMGGQYCWCRFLVRARLHSLLIVWNEFESFVFFKWGFLISLVLSRTFTPLMTRI